MPVFFSFLRVGSSCHFPPPPFWTREDRSVNARCFFLTGPLMFRHIAFLSRFDPILQRKHDTFSSFSELNWKGMSVIFIFEWVEYKHFLTYPWCHRFPSRFFMRMWSEKSWKQEEEEGRQSQDRWLLLTRRGKGKDFADFAKMEKKMKTATKFLFMAWWQFYCCTATS